MCFADVKFGRTATRKIRSVTLGVTAVQLCKADPRRIALFLASHTTARYTIGEGPDVALDAGPTLHNVDPPWIFLVQEFGQMCTGELWAIASAAATNVGVIEVFLQSDPKGM